MLKCDKCKTYFGTYLNVSTVNAILEGRAKIRVAQCSGCRGERVFAICERCADLEQVQKDPCPWCGANHSWYTESMLPHTKGEVEKAYCDICSANRQGTWVGSEDMRTAVFKNGFNPFATELGPLALGGPLAYEPWKNIVVAQDTTDWNVCERCMLRLRPYLEGLPTPTGTKETVVSTSPIMSAIAGAAATERYRPSSPPLDLPGINALGFADVSTAPSKQPSKKKWWQFWVHTPLLLSLILVSILVRK